MVRLKHSGSCVKDLNLYNLRFNNNGEVKKVGMRLHNCFHPDINCMPEKLGIDPPSCGSLVPCYQLSSCVMNKISVFARASNRGDMVYLCACFTFLA